MLQTNDKNLEPGLFRFEFKAMACNGEIVVGASSKDEARHNADLAIHEVKRIEQKYSRYQPDSVVSRINAAAGREWVECDDETLALFNYADALFQGSAGLFDITSGVLRRAWDFNNPAIPSTELLKNLVDLIGWPRVQRDDKRIRLPQRGMEVDFGGFGKEYATDRAAAILNQLGIKHGYVNLGGDLRVIGPKPNGDAWMMGIRDPRNPAALIASIPVQVGALATSGDYERFFELNGRRYCHVMSPRSGEPVGFWRSVSVLAPLSTTAGSYTTIAMLKEAAGLAWLEESGMAYLAIDRDGTLHQKTGH